MKIAVVFGGNSEERDVSIASGVQVINGLRECGHEVVAIDSAQGQLTEHQERKLQQFQILDIPPASCDLTFTTRLPATVMTALDVSQLDLVFIALHGGAGEDGTIQSLLDVSGIPYTGTGHVGSTLAMDKDLSKRIMQAAGIPTPAWQMCSPANTDIVNNLEFPVIVKPNAQGSTVGLSLVHRAAELSAAIAKAGEFGDEIMLEAYIPGRELTVGILDNEALAVGEIIVEAEIFDYQSKYQGLTNEIFPAEITLKQQQTIQQIGLSVHKALKLNCYSRIDFRMDESGGLWVLEANTVPGLTAMSLLPQSATAAGIEFPALCDKICHLALNKPLKR